MTTTTHRGTIDAEQFGALCNLFCATHCQQLDPTPGQAGDILYFRADPMVCDHSRLVARAVLAYLGITTDQPDGAELIREVRAAMANGEGYLPDEPEDSAN